VSDYFTIVLILNQKNPLTYCFSYNVPNWHSVYFVPLKYLFLALLNTSQLRWKGIKRKTQMKKKFLKGLVASFVLATATANAGLIGLNEIVNTNTTSTGPLVGDGLYDAFDGFGYLSNLNGLSVNRQVDTLESDYTYRFFDQFTNNTQSSINTVVRFGGNLGSDGRENIYRSDSYSHITFEDWNNDGIPDYDPVLAFTFGNNLWAENNITSLPTSNYFHIDISLELAAGETASILFFSTLIRDDTNRSGDMLTASLYADSFISNPDFSGLNSSQQSSIVNFNVTEVPEPSTLAVFALGLVGLASRKFKKKA
jgi:hypothetical protein